MSDKLVQTTAQIVSANTQTYTPKVTDVTTSTITATISNQTIANTPVEAIKVTDVTTSTIDTAVSTPTSINTTVDTIRVVGTIVNMGEESIPEPKLFTRLDDYYATTDTISLTYGTTKTDQASLQDTVSKRPGKGILDSQTASDSIFQIRLNKAQLDSLAASETLTASFGKQLAHTVSETDTALLTVTKVVSDLTTLAEVFNYSFGKGLEETIASTDTFDRVVNFSREFDSPVDATDDFLGLANLDDDQIARVGKTLIDWTTSSDTTIIVVGNNTLDVINTADQAVFQASSIIADAGLVQDQAAFNAGKTVSSTGTTSELVTEQFGKNIVDPATLTDLASNGVFKRLLDSLLAQEAFSTKTTKVVEDGVALSDTLTTVVVSTETTKLVEDVVALNDTINLFLYTNRFLNETTSTNDSGFINNQSYFAESYVEPGYVGTNTNFS